MKKCVMGPGIRGYSTPMRISHLSVALFALAAGALGFSWETQGVGGQGAKQGPGLEWRTLDGQVLFRAMDQAPGEEVDPMPATRMRPVGLAPFPALEEGKDLAELTLLPGDRMWVRVVGGDAEALMVEGAGKTRLKVPIDRILTLEYPGRRSATGLFERPESGDRLYRRVGSTVDRVDGVLLGFSEQGVAMETSLGERVFPWGEVVGLTIEPLGEVLESNPRIGGSGNAKSSSAKGDIVLLDLTCGSRLRGQLKAIGKTGVTVTVPGAEWNIPHPWVRDFLWLNGSFEFLSWLPPVDADNARSPFDPPGSEPLGMVWPHRVDRAVGGGVLRAGGRTWSHGIGVHAPSHLTWELTGKDKFLRLSAGLDDTAQRAGKGGSVTFEVRVDGEQAWASGLRRGGGPLVTPDPISIEGAKKLELIVTDGGDGPVLDRAAWLEPMLVR